MVFHAVLIGSLYLLFAGHNQPGGGFVGGLVAGAAISLRYLAGGIDEVRATQPVPAVDDPRGRCRAGRDHGARARCCVGDPVLERRSGTSFDLPLLGTCTLSTTLVFDIGVYLVVVGLVFMVFEAFGDDATARRRTAMRS